MKKKILSLLAIIGIIIASNFSRIPEDKDPIIGIWTATQLKNSTATNALTIEKKWVFNDTYKGTYHSNDGDVNVLLDFKWKKENNLYTISYLGSKNKTKDTILIKKSETKTMLVDNNKKILAIRK